MKRTIALLIFTVVVASMLVAGLVFRSSNGGLVRNVQAKEKGCTVATLEGEYLVTGTAQANIDQRDNPTYPRIVVGVATYDGAGNWSSVFTRSFGGRILRHGTIEGTYTLDSDCTGTLHSSGGVNWDLFVSRDGSEGNEIEYDEGTISTFSFKRQ